MANELIELAKKNDIAVVHAEADQYYMVDGKYLFDMTKIKQAHEYCQQKVLDALKFGKSVIVSNTSTTYKEVKPYIKMARQFDVQYEIIDLDKTNYGNIHGVPVETLEAMKKRWTPKAEIEKLITRDIFNGEL